MSFVAPADAASRGCGGSPDKEGSPEVYAIVRSGGRQHKVAVGDVVEVNRLAGERGEVVSLPPVLVVDDGKVTVDNGSLARYQVNAEITAQTQGPKLDILNWKSKTGYRRRLGHRQQLTQLKVTGIDTSTYTSTETSTETSK